MPSSVAAQGTAADYERMDKYFKGLESCAQPTVEPHWLPSNESFWYRKVDPRNVSEFVFVDAVKGVRKPAFDHVKLARALSAKNIPANASSLPFTSIVPTADGSVVRFRAGGQAWQFDSNSTLTPFLGDLGEGRLEKITDNSTSTPTDGSQPQITSRQTKLGRPPILNIKRADSNRITSRQIKLGRPPILNIKRADHNFLSNTSSRDGPSIGNFSSKFPDGNITQVIPSIVAGYSIVYDTTPEQTHPVYMVQSSPKNQTQPLLRQMKEKEFWGKEFLKPGDTVAIDHVRLFKDGKEIPIDDALFKNPYYIEDLGWNLKGTEYQLLFSERGNRIERIIGIALDGSVRVILEESQKTFIDWSQKFYIHPLGENPSNASVSDNPDSLTGKDEFIWFSERSGWNHLYMVTVKTGAIKPITQGEWVVKNVTNVDEVGRQLWFEGLGMVPGQDYYHSHLARINFDGTGMKILTADVDASHSWELSPWGPSSNSSPKYFIDRYSRVDLPVKIVLRSAETGKVIVDLEEGSMDCYKSAGWTVPERFVAKGRDGKTDIYGIIIKPPNLDPNRKYPVIEYIYAGPNDFFVPKTFNPKSGMTLRAYEYAQLGFIVVRIDGMGSNWRSKAFHDVCYKNLKDAGFLDRIAWMKEAQKSRPWMDLERVGIYGSSAGGQNAMAALLFHPSFYKAGAADSGSHDQRMDKMWWGEMWLGYPVDQSYIDSSNVANAYKLEGSLMLLVPELDDNVDPATTMQVSNALITAGKDHELVVLPGESHGAGLWTRYGLRKQHDFFVRELMGVVPPKWNRLPSTGDGHYIRHLPGGEKGL
ncbi:von Hippel-Lindau disease tumor suppressor [Venturia nashicola]|nr:von Hippel-Lindau disease tumor suppressor [Venturia nashicola]